MFDSQIGYIWIYGIAGHFGPLSGKNFKTAETPL